MSCKKKKTESEFSKYAWRSPADRNCKDCSRKTKGQWQCIACKKRLGKEMFAKWLSNRKDKWKKDGTARCNDCMEKAEANRRKVHADTQKHVQKRG